MQNLKITQTTWLKSEPVQSTLLPIEDKVLFSMGKVIEISRRLPDKLGHYQVEVVTPIQGRYNWFVWANHAGIELADEDPNIVGAVSVVSPAVTNHYDVRFTMSPQHSNKLLTGLLEFRCNGKTYNEIIVTSSLPGRQYEGSWNRRGGLIPPTSMIKEKTGAGLSVKTSPIFMPNTLGVSGNFYPISPFETETDGDTRGDWGCHMDCNTPGSLGCLVAETERGWIAIQREFNVLAKLGIRSVDLIVEYSL